MSVINDQLIEKYNSLRTDTGRHYFIIFLDIARVNSYICFRNGENATIMSLNVMLAMDSWEFSIELIKQLACLVNDSRMPIYE